MFLEGAGPNLTARVKNQEQSWNILGKSHSSPLTARLSIGQRLTNEYEKKKNSEVLMTDKFFDMLYSLGGNHPAFSLFCWRENNPRDVSLHPFALEKGQNIQIYYNKCDSAVSKFQGLYSQSWPIQ